MKTTTSSKGNIVAIITMMFLFAMISFVTNLAAPVGVIWKNTFAGGENANTIGMLGNAMNFLAYLFMGIPSGKMLAKIGYKNTAMTGVATGIAGLVLQFLSGTCSSAELGFSIYLLGAFVCGFSVCMLNTVVNPMINLLGGGGNRGNQLNLIGGTLNSLSGTLTPMLVGSLIGEVTKDTKIANVNVVLFIAMAVFAAAFCILYFIKINNPEHKPEEKLAHSPWDFSNFKLGAIAIFLYVGLEVGIPGTLFFYISDTTDAGGGTGLAKATAGGWLCGCHILVPDARRKILRRTHSRQSVEQGHAHRNIPAGNSIDARSDNSRKELPCGDACIHRLKRGNIPSACSCTASRGLRTVHIGDVVVHLQPLS